MTLISSLESTAATHTLSPLTLTYTVAVRARKVTSAVPGKVSLPLEAMLTAIFGLGRALISATDITFERTITTAYIPGSQAIMAASALLISGELTRWKVVATLTLDLRRGRMLATEAVVAMGLAFVAACWALIVTGVAYLLVPALAGVTLPPNLEPSRITVMFGRFVFTTLAGQVLGLFVRNVVVPIVVTLVWPAVSMLVARPSEVAQEIIVQIDLGPVAALFYSPAQAQVQLGTPVLTWIILPGTIGAQRLFRGDL